MTDTLHAKRTEFGAPAKETLRKSNVRISAKMIPTWRLQAAMFGNCAMQAGPPANRFRTAGGVVAFCSTGLLFPDNESGMMRGSNR